MRGFLSNEDCLAVSDFLAEYLDNYAKDWDDEQLKTAMHKVMMALRLADKIEIVPDYIVSDEKVA
jgi:hypothetical protein